MTRSRLIVFTVALTLAGGVHVLAEDAAASPEEPPPKPKVTFSPEVEKKFAEVLDKITEAKRRIWSERAQKEIADIVKVAGAAPESAKSLETAAERVAEICTAPSAGPPKRAGR